MLKAITDAKLDAVVGYTQRFRRKWLGAKEKVRTGALGDVTMVTSRAFINRLVAIDNYKRTDDPTTISPMVISGTHALDIVMWYMEQKTPVECYARSVDKVLGPLYHGIDATAGMIMFADGAVHTLSISWALPVTWPGAVYSLEVGINGTDGVLTIDDTHRDMVLAVSKPKAKAMRRTPAGWSISWAPIRPATWCLANCAGRWLKKPCRGSTAFLSGCRRRRRPPRKRITG